MVGRNAGTQVLLCGDNCVNVVLETPGALTRGASIDLKRSVLRPGGNALVTALALAGWGVRAAYAGVVGADEDGRDLLHWMRRVDVETGAVVVRGRTRRSYAIVDPDERTILDERRESDGLTNSDWNANRSLRDAVRTAGLILIDRYCAGIHGSLLDEVGSGRSLGKAPRLIYRTGSRHSDGLEIEKKVLPAADICLTKRAFLDSLGLKGGPVGQCERLADWFGVPVVVATLGKDGAAYCEGAGMGGVVPARTIEKVETTLGGGDWFRAGFIFALVGGMSLADSVRWGNAAAGLHCSRPESDEPVLEFFSIDELKTDTNRRI